MAQNKFLGKGDSQPHSATFKSDTVLILPKVQFGNSSNSFPLLFWTGRPGFIPSEKRIEADRGKRSKVVISRSIISELLEAQIKVYQGLSRHLTGFLGPILTGLYCSGWPP